MLLRLIRWMRGYLEISVEGGIAERFLSICGRRNIILWNMKSGKVLTACIFASDFKRIRMIASKSNTKVRIERRRGFPFVMKRYRGRKIFVLCILLFFISLHCLTSLIWRVEVVGVQQTDLFVLHRILEENGVKKWARSKSVDEEKIQFEILQQLDTVSWAGITIKGTDVTVEIKEREPTPEMLPADQPCDLIAAKDGVVELMLVKEGEAVVKVGDTVSKGQLLVSALKGVEIENPVPVHSFGEVIARTWTQKSKIQPMVLEEKELTGQQKTRFGLKISKIFINFFGNTGNLYPKCDTIEETVWKSGKLALVKRVIREVKLTHQELTEEEAGNLAEEELTKELSMEMPEGAELVSVTRNVQVTEQGSLKVDCTFECLENIAIQKIFEPEIQGELWDDTKNSNNEQYGAGNGSDG